MWPGSVEKDVKNKGLRNWRCKSLDREERRTVLKEAKVISDYNASSRRMT
jgi:hypothetical protein